MKLYVSSFLCGVRAELRSDFMTGKPVPIKLVENDLNFGAWGFIGLDLQIILDIDGDQSLKCKVLHEPKSRPTMTRLVLTPYVKIL